MQTFRHLDNKLGSIPHRLITTLVELGASRGTEELYRERSPQVLETLRQVARIQSTEASNAIEQITAPHARIRELVEEKTRPENRSEEEIAGYRYVLDTIHASAQDIPFSVNLLLQFHRDLLRFTPDRNAGRFKITDNLVTEEVDGQVVVRFTPVPAGDTKRAMEELHERFTFAWDEGEHDRLLLIAAYVLDFLIIHPFLDGNGRMARLITLLLLYHAGYEVGRFISLEKLINESRETYFDSLGRSTAGWHEGKHDPLPWVRYLLGILTAAYKELEDRVGAVTGRGSKRELVLGFLRSSARDRFTFDEIRRAAPGVSDAYIRKLLADLRKQGVVESEGRGRYATWRRLHRDF